MRPLVYAVQNHLGDDVARLLQLRKANPETRDSDETPVLLIAARSATDSCFEQIISYFPDIEAQDQHGNTAIHIAVMHGYLEHVGTLLRLNAKSDGVNNDGKTPLSLAIEHGHTHVADMLKSAMSSNQLYRTEFPIGNPEIDPRQRSLSQL